MNHKKHTTTPEVWRAIKAEHGKELQVFSSFSNPDGEFMGFSGRGEMMTEYGFPGSEVPLIGIRTTWEISENREHGPESHQYWLCTPVSDD